MTTVIYARQSKDRDGNAAAVDRQMADCRELAHTLGLEVAREFVDNDVSASKGVRPAFTDLLRGVRAGQISTIIVWHTDRLYRRVRDLVELVELAEKHPLNIATVRAGDLDLNNATGRMMAQIMGAVARQEVEHKGERQVTANQQRAKAGVWQFSNRPYGYERVNGEVVIVEAEAAVLRAAYASYLEGDTLYSIVARLNAANTLTMKGTEWSVAKLRARLLNPANAGVRVYRGDKSYKGDWEPIIDTVTWERFKTQQARRRHAHTWSNKTKYLLSGLALCGVCGSKLMARPEYGRAQADGTKPVRMTYQCVTNWCVSRNLERVDALVNAVVIGRLSLPDAASLLNPASDIDALISKSQELASRRNDLATALAEGALTLPAVREESAKLSDQIDALQERIAAADGSTELGTLLLADSIADGWNNRLSLAAKRSIIGSLMTVSIAKQASTRVFDPEAVTIDWLTPAP